MVIVSLNPIHSVFWLVMVFISTSGFFITLDFQFISLILIIIYVGAITILFLFVIMMLDVIQLKKANKINHAIPIIVITSVNFLIQLWFSIGETKGNNWIPSWVKEWDFNTLNTINSLGNMLYDEFMIPFILVSLLLLIAMIGAIVLTLELGSLTKRQSLSHQHQRNNSWI